MNVASAVSLSLGRISLPKSGYTEEELHEKRMDGVHVGLTVGNCVLSR